MTYQFQAPGLNRSLKSLRFFWTTTITVIGGTLLAQLGTRR